MFRFCNKFFRIWSYSSILLQGITVLLQPKIKSATKNRILIASKDMKTFGHSGYASNRSDRQNTQNQNSKKHNIIN